MDKMELRATVNQLVEAWHDQVEAQRQLDRFKASHMPPTPPNQFEGLQELLEFDERKRSYQAGLTNHQDQLDAAKKAYKEAADKLREVLPNYVGLQYTYQGGLGGLEGGRYFIVPTRNKIDIRWYEQPKSPPP